MGVPAMRRRQRIDLFGCADASRTDCCIICWLGSDLVLLRLQDICCHGYAHYVGGGLCALSSTWNNAIASALYI